MSSPRFGGGPLGEGAFLTDDAYEPLTGGLTLLFGIDPIVSLRDNSDVPSEHLPDVLAWSARELVRAILAEARTD